ncbi:MAG: PAS domain S-box protein [Candidatus Obscuribacter sp.]|nr:PAS domain S-box protein [Candidatus Obscuribacter sp.]
MMLSNSSVLKRIIFIFAFPLAFQFVIFFVLGALLQKAESVNEEILKSREILSLAELSMVDFCDTLSHFVSYSNSQYEGFVRKFDASCERTRGHIARLVDLSNGDRSRMERAARLKSNVDGFLSLASKILASHEREDQSSGPAAILQLKLFNRLAGRFDSLGSDIKSIAEAEKNTAFSLAEDRAQSWRFVYLVLGGGLIVDTLITVALCRILAQNLAVRLAALKEKSVSLADSKLLSPSISGSDDIAELDRVICRVSEVLVSSQQLERALVDNAADLIFSLDSDGRFLRVNPAFEKRLYFRSGSLLSRGLETIVLQGERENLEQVLFAARQSNQVHFLELSMVDARGGVYTFNLSFQWSDSLKQFICTGHDISQMKRQQEMLASEEKRLRALLEQLPMAVFALSQDLRIEFANAESERLLGFRRESLTGVDFNRLFSDPAATDFLSIVRDVDAGVDRGKFELSLTVANGTEKVCELSVVVYRVVEHLNILVIATDLTDRIRSERLRRDFVAMVSHDLRSPLNSVMAYIQLLARGNYGPLSTSGHEGAVAANQSIERLIKLTSDLLQLERLESGVLSLDLQSCSNLELVRAAIDSVAHVAETKEVYLVVEGTEVTLTADKDRLIQVLVNLLANAIDFSEPQSDVIVRTVALPDKQVEFRVVDSGPGIAREKLSCIFDRFGRGESVNARGEARMSAGFGLAIAREIVLAHGGSIGVDSEPGQGSQFYFRCPQVYSLRHKQL